MRCSPVLALSAALALQVLVPAQEAAVPTPQAFPPAYEALPVLLVSGQNNHDWQFTHQEIAAALRATERFAVTTTTKPQEELASLDLSRFAAIVLDYNGARWGEAAEKAFLAAVANGCGVVVVHAANNAFDGWTEYETLVGLCWRQGTGHGAYHPFDVHVVDAAHPVTAGMDDLRLHPDELYHRLVPTKGAEFRVLMSAFSDPKSGGTGRYEPMATVAHYGKARVFHTPLGHTWTGQVPTRASWRDPQLRHLVARGTEWAATGTVTLPAQVPNVLAESERAAGFVSLFDGKSLDAFRAYRSEGLPRQGWVVENGAIVHRQAGGGGDLVTRQEFGDFDFRFDWRVAERANSGVIWHVVETEEQTYMTGPEYQVYDDLGAKPDARHGAGALYDLVPNTGAELRAAGRWNEGRIVVQKGRVQHWLNGTKLVDAPCAGPEWDAMVAGSKFRVWPFGKSATGRIALQDHGDAVAFKNLRIAPL